MDDCLSRICVASDESLIDPPQIKILYEKNAEEFEKRNLYEKNITSSAFPSLPTTSQLASYLTYIRFEITEQQISRAQRLFERAVMVLYNCADLWLEYVDFIEQQVKNTHTLVSVTSRAVIGCRDNGSLWRLR